ncbi:MAG: class I SAM-dependent methyltransferase [Chlamydiota bacterium]
MGKSPYYLEYLQTTDRFPQSVYHRAKHDMVRQVFRSLEPASLVLDAGCGVGHVTARYCAEYRVIGIDEQLSALQQCLLRCKGRYAQSSLYRLPLRDNVFDAILFLDAIEHLTHPVIVLKELARVLKPEGVILICTMNYESPLWFILEHTWHRFFGGPCKPYSKDVHPTRYTERLLREHGQTSFQEVYLQKRVMNMELFYLGKKTHEVK